MSIPHLICGFRLAVPDLQFYRHPLCKQSLIPDPYIIIKRLENKFDSCHLSLLDHSDWKIRSNYFFFHIYFNITQQLTPYNWEFTIHWHLWKRLLQLIRKLRSLMDKTLASFLTEKLSFESVHSYWQNNHSKTILLKALTEKCFVRLSFVTVIFSHKCRTCPKSPILDKPRLVIGSGQLLWSRHVNLFLSNVSVVSCSFLSRSSVKSSLSNISIALLVALSFTVFVGKKRFS